MGYIGKEPPRSPSQSQLVEKFSGTGAQTDFVMSKRPSNVYSTAVFISGVYQLLNQDYTLSGYHINFLVAPATGTENIVVHHIAIQETAIVPVDGSVTVAKLDPSVPLGATGGGSNKVFFENDATVTYNYTITSGKNAMSAGPVVVADGITVTVPSGSEWSIV